jgi:hypothetical protein
MAVLTGQEWYNFYTSGSKDINTVVDPEQDVTFHDLPPATVTATRTHYWVLVLAFIVFGAIIALRRKKTSYGRR